MAKETKQHCKICNRIFNNGTKEWETLTDKHIIKLNAEIYAGEIQILEEPCIECYENDLAGLGCA